MTITTITTTTTLFATASGLLVHIDTDAGFAACIGLAGLRLAHNADIAVGCHPYSVATAWISVALLPTLAPADIAEADEAMVADWASWADDVFALAAEDAMLSLASAAQVTGSVTDARLADEANVALAHDELDIAVRPLDIEGIRRVTRFAANQSSAAALA
jgi:hypothetical protein